MGAKTGIQWTSATWNPTRGCSRVSEGCRNCYAENVAARFSNEGQPYHGLARWTEERHPKWTGKVVLVESQLALPLRWEKPRRIFVNSMSDLFHESLPEKDIAASFGVMAMACHHIFQVLTKRAERMRVLMRRLTLDDCLHAAIERGINLPTQAERRRMLLALPQDSPFRPGSSAPLWPLPNVHLGVSIEDQTTADERIPKLLAVDDATRFVSYEPALAAVDFRAFLTWRNFMAWTHGGSGPANGSWKIRGKPLAWIIVGGESGPNARPFDVRWAADTITACRTASVAIFVKQLGSRPMTMCPSCGAGSPEAMGTSCDYCESFTAAIPGKVPLEGMKHHKGGLMEEWPEALRVREFPGGL